MTKKGISFRASELISRIFASRVHKELVPGIPIIVIFVRHRSKKNEWLAISVDLTLTAPEIIQIYALR